MAQGCKKLGIDLVGLQEHRLKTSNIIDRVEDELGGLLVLTSANDRGQGGVGIYFSKRSKDRLLSCEQVSERILISHLEAKPNITVVSAYSPTNCNENSETNEEFYRQMEDIVKKIHPHYVVIILGDFNARVGKDSRISSPTTVGRHSFHEETNENGLRLVNMCESTGLCLALSRLPYRIGRRWTWRHALGTKAQLDHILIRSKWVNSLRNCRVYSSLDLGSDHRMVSASFRLSLRNSIRVKDKEKSFDWDKLKKPEIKHQFNLDVKNRLEALKDELKERHNLQAEYDALLKGIEESAKVILDLKPRTKRHLWVSEKTKKLLIEKEKAHIVLASKSENEFKNAESLKTKVKFLAKEVANALAEDEINELENQLHHLVNADRNKHPRSTWQTIAKISGKDKKQAIKVKTKATSEKEISSEWRTYFNDLLYARSTTNIQPSFTQSSPSLTPKLNPEDFNISEFATDEIDEAIRAFKSNKAPGVDSCITTELLKEGGYFLRDILKDICNSILSGSDPPWQWR